MDLPWAANGGLGDRAAKGTSITELSDYLDLFKGVTAEKRIASAGEPRLQPCPSRIEPDWRLEHASVALLLQVSSHGQGWLWRRSE